MKIILYKNNVCSLCTLMLHELIENPPNCDVVISHYSEETFFDDNGNEVKTKQPCNIFPTIVILDKDTEIGKLTGFVSTKIINEYIKNYEAKHMV